MEAWSLAAAWTEAISGAIGALVAVITGWLAYQKYLQEEHIEASEDRIEVFSTSKQTTELRATEHGLELHLHDIRPDRGGIQWTISPSDAKSILQGDEVAVRATSKNRNSGTFDIGSRKRWLYSKSLYPEPKDLHGDIRKLLKVASDSS